MWENIEIFFFFATPLFKYYVLRYMGLIRKRIISDLSIHQMSIPPCYFARHNVENEEFARESKNTQMSRPLTYSYILQSVEYRS